MGGGLPKKQMLLWVGNESAIKSASNEEVGQKNRHFALRHHMVRDENERLRFCPTELQRADGLTKMVGKQARAQLLGTYQ